MNLRGYLSSLIGISVVVGLILYLSCKIAKPNTVVLLGSLLWLFGCLFWTFSYLENWRSEEDKKSNNALSIAIGIVVSLLLVVVIPWLVCKNKPRKSSRKEDLYGFA